MGMVECVLLWWLVVWLKVYGVTGDVGTATSYDPPYMPTSCNGYNQAQFPDGGMFAAASIGLWDNGAACGRRYRLRCLSGPRRPCKGGTIIVEVVDICHPGSLCPLGSTLALSNEAFDIISRVDTKINIEFVQI